MKALNNKLKDLGVTYSHLGDQDLHRKWALLRQQTASGLPEDAPAPLNTSAKTDVAASTDSLACNRSFSVSWPNSFSLFVPFSSLTKASYPHGKGSCQG
jgi:hypothetical protein